MKLKKLIALGLAMAMTVTALAACGNTNSGKSSAGSSASQSSQAVSSAVSSSAENSTETTEGITFPLVETMTFEGLGMVADEAKPLSTSATIQAITEWANIKFEWTEIPYAEAKEKGNLIMASGDYPDFLYKMSDLSANTYGMNGSLIPLEDLIREYMPNLCAILDEREGWASITASDGHIYSLPQISNPTFYGRSNAFMYINKRYLDNLGLKMPTSIEEYYDVLKAFKEQDANGNGDPNDEIPLNMRNIFGDVSITTLYIYMSDLALYINDYLGITEEGELVFYPYDESFREWISWMTKFYEEGLLHDGVFTQTSDQMKALTNSTDTLGSIARSGTNNYVPQEYYGDYYMMPVFEGANIALSNGILTGGLSITDKCENPEVLCVWADYLYTEEGGRIQALGVEDVAWKWNAEGMIETIPEEEWSVPNAGTLKQSGSNPGYDHINNIIKVVYTDMSSVRKADAYKEGGVFTEGIYLPSLTLTEEDKETVSIIKTDMGAYIENFITETVSGVRPLDDAAWEEFEKTLKAMRADEYFEYYKAAYESAVAK